MRWAGRVLAALLPGLLVLGCTRIVDGTTKPAPGLQPRPVTGEAVKEVLPDGVALSDVFGQSFEAKAEFRPRFGGVGELQKVPGSPADCLAASRLMPRQAYQDTETDTIATRSWWNSTPDDLDPAVINVDLGVAAQPTVAAAGTLFDAFSQRWRGCSGTPVSVANGRFISTIRDVRLADSVVSGVVSVEFSDAGPTIDHLHALGVRANCLVEVDIALYGKKTATDEDRLTDITRQMLDTVSELT